MSSVNYQNTLKCPVKFDKIELQCSFLDCAFIMKHNGKIKSSENSIYNLQNYHNLLSRADSAISDSFKEIVHKNRVLRLPHEIGIEVHSLRQDLTVGFNIHCLGVGLQHCLSSSQKDIVEHLT
jgi:hypothetical protein